MYILIDKSHIDKQIAKEMFAFYAIQIADNCYYWDFFQENYHIDDAREFDDRQRLVVAG